MSDSIRVRTALLSVSDKSGLDAFAGVLRDFGVKLISTGGTHRTLESAGFDVTPIEQITEFPEMMDGRVKTLHPRVHGGLLALRDEPSHVRAMEAHGIGPIDLVCINLYPFEQTIAKAGVTDAEAIEQIDIGGPSMIRSAAKNHRFVACVTGPEQYDTVAEHLRANDGSTTLSLRSTLATAAFERTSRYDTVIHAWLSSRNPATANA